jgi:hypothetical protein
MVAGRKKMAMGYFSISMAVIFQDFRGDLQVSPHRSLYFNR